MIRSGRPVRKWGVGASLVALCLLSVAVAGCGPTGTAAVTIKKTPTPDGSQPPTPAPGASLVTGVVSMPNGVLASTNSWWQWAGGFRPFAAAYGTTVPNPSVGPIPAGAKVSLSRVDPLDAADGVIGNLPGRTPLLLGKADTGDNPRGRYTIIQNGNIDISDLCGVIVAVGSEEQNTLTRAFVLSAAQAGDTNIDVVSETVVRVVLNRLAKAPPVQLCDNFSTAGLLDITEAVSSAVYAANGIDAFGINEAAFAKALANETVQATVDAVTGVSVAAN
jgi:hypothetical protein